MLVQEFLERSADRMPDKISLVCDGERVTYDELEWRANRLANALLARGFERGERAVIFLPNSIEAVVSIFAVLKAGGVFVPANHTMKYARLKYIVENCQATVLIASGRYVDWACHLIEEVASLRSVLLVGLPFRPSDAPEVEIYDVVSNEGSTARPRKTNIDLDLACLVYTSGSTGEPQGVMSDHSNVVFATGSITGYLQNEESDVVVNVLPLSFDYGLYQLLMTTRFGGTLVLEKGFEYPAAVLAHMAEERVTGFPGVPTIFALILYMDTRAYDLKHLRYLTNTAAALPPNHINQLRQRFPTARLYSMYGLTETKRTLYLPPEQLDIRPASVGIAIPGTEVWIEDGNGNRLGPEQVGELVVRGRHVMRGYWGNPTATAARFPPGPIPGERLCYTGDLFRMDAGGYFYFVARKDEVIKSRGEKVAPKEIESVLYALPGIIEAAVVGVPDPVLGEAVKAFVVASDPRLGEAQVLAHCRAWLEPFKVPRQVVICDALPKTSSGKIRKTDLR